MALTGRDVAELAGVPIVLGNIDAYEWRRRVLVLRECTAKGTDTGSLIIAAHEVAHRRQQEDWPWIRWWFRFFEPFRLWQEADAWKRAKVILANQKDRPRAGKFGNGLLKRDDGTFTANG
jgi:hypothetical protein